MPLFKTDRARSAVGGVFPEEKLRDREIWRSLLLLVRRRMSVVCFRFEKRTTCCRWDFLICVRRRRITTKSLEAAYRPTSLRTRDRCQ